MREATQGSPLPIAGGSERDLMGALKTSTAYDVDGLRLTPKAVQPGDVVLLHLDFLPTCMPCTTRWYLI